MSIIDVVLALAAETGDLLDGASSVPDFQVLRVEPHIDLLADQTTVNGVGVAAHMDDATGVNSPRTRL